MRHAAEYILLAALLFVAVVTAVALINAPPPIDPAEAYDDPALPVSSHSIAALCQEGEGGRIVTEQQDVGDVSYCER